MPYATPPPAKAAPRLAHHRIALNRPQGPVPATTGASVVGIGASAGGLEACTLLLDALPAATGMIFILVQHLDPTHKGLLVDLLAERTALTVLEGDGYAADVAINGLAALEMVWSTAGHGQAWCWRITTYPAA